MLVRLVGSLLTMPTALSGLVSAPLVLASGQGDLNPHEKAAEVQGKL